MFTGAIELLLDQYSRETEGEPIERMDKTYAALTTALAKNEKKMTFSKVR